MKSENTYPLEIDVHQAQTLLRENPNVQLIDVREPSELAICQIDGHRAIPMGEIPQHLNQLPREPALIIQCHHGGRSMQVVQYLRQNGFDNAINLAGGIDQWSEKIDPQVPRY